MHALWHALLLAHQPHDNTYGLAATPDGQTVFVDSRHCVYRSQDAGDSWQKANGAGLPLVAGGTKEVVATARVVNKVKPLEVSVRIKD